MSDLFSLFVIGVLFVPIFIPIFLFGRRLSKVFDTDFKDERRERKCYT